MGKVAIFVDWENLRMDISSIQKNKKNFREFNYNSSTHLNKLFFSFLEENEEIYRIFFYTALPKSSEEIKKSLKNKIQRDKYDEFLSQADQKGISNRDKFQQILKKAKDLIKDIEKEQYVATRLGELKINGIQDSGKPIINQKQVDMLLGLDISHVSYNRLVDTILVFCKDSDMTPALKVARINGIKTVIANIEEGFNITSSLIKHSDIIRSKSINEILDFIKK